MFLRRRGFSLLPLSPPLSRGHTVITPRRNETYVTCRQIIQFELDTPPTPLRAFMLNLSLLPPPPSQTQTCRLLLWDFSTDSVLSVSRVRTCLPAYL